jgi:hypothetical protein
MSTDASLPYQVGSQIGAGPQYKVPFSRHLARSGPNVKSPVGIWPDTADSSVLTTETSREETMVHTSDEFLSNVTTQSVDESRATKQLEVKNKT